jgi:hypothetical protein
LRAGLDFAGEVLLAFFFAALDFFFVAISFFVTLRFAFDLGFGFVAFFVAVSTMEAAPAARARVVFTIVPATLPTSSAIVLNKGLVGVEGLRGADFFFIDLFLYTPPEFLAISGALGTRSTHPQ